MNLNDLLPNGGIAALAGQLGIPPEQARRGAEALLPSVLGGMGDNAAGLDTHINALGGAGLAHNVVGDQPTEITRGNALLGGIFGSKDVSRQVAGQAAQNSGLDPTLLKQMLPILAMLVAGHLAGRSGAWRHARHDPWRAWRRGSRWGRERRRPRRWLGGHARFDTGRPPIDRMSSRHRA